MSRHITRDVCRLNVKFVRALPDESPHAPREALAGKDSRTVARGLLEISHAQFSARGRTARSAVTLPLGLQRHRRLDS